MQRRLIPLLVLLIAAAGFWQRGALMAPAAGALPAEAIATLDLIRQGGPYPYRQDGRVFQNREGLLPAAPSGHYREYTVPTPGARDRGARRIVTGGDPPAAWYYTDDHYRSFRPVTAGGVPLDQGGDP